MDKKAVHQFGDIVWCIDTGKVYAIQNEIVFKLLPDQTTKIFYLCMQLDEWLEGGRQKYHIEEKILHTVDDKVKQKYIKLLEGARK